MRKTNKSMLLIFALLIAVVLSLSAVSAEDVAADGDIISVDDSISDVSLDDASIGETANEIGSVEASSEDSDNTVSTDSGEDTLGEGDSSVWYVDSNVETTGDGSQASPFKTIKEAVDAGNGTIYLASGIYNSTDDMGFEFRDNSSYTIIGSGTENTVIDLLTSYYFFTCVESTAYISDVKIINGNWGVRNLGGNLTVENCLFETCIDSGVQSNGNSIVRNCTFKENIASYGSGVAISNNWMDAPAINIIENCNFIHNLLYGSSNRGSAISVTGNRRYQTDIIVKDCNFTQCRRTIYVTEYSNLSLDNCIFTENYDDEYDQYSSSTTGSVITVDRYANITIDSCIFENNTRDNGSLIVADGWESRDMVIKNSQFINNVPNMINATVKAAYGGNLYLENNTCDSVFVDVGSNGVNVISNVEMAAFDGQTVNADTVLIPLWAVLTDDNGNLMSYSRNYVKVTLNGTQKASNLPVVGGYCNYSLKEKLDGAYEVNFAITGTEFTNITYKAGTLIVENIKDNIDIYVSTDGDDETGDGTEANPFKTVEKALDVSNTVCSANIYIKGGTYEYNNYREIDTVYGLLNVIGYDGDVIIDMGNATAFCNITNRSNVEFSNIAFINGYMNRYKNYNSGIFTSKGGYLAFRHCNFTNNKGYYTTIKSANLIDSCTFENNIPYSSSSYNGADVMGVGTLINSTFYGSSQTTNPSVTFENDLNDSYVENCKFYNNASIRKGGIYIQAHIVSCEFINSNVVSINAQYNATYIDNCTFINSSKNSIQMPSGDSNVSITNCKFINITGTGTNSAIYDQGIAELYLENNTVENNVAPYAYISYSTPVTSPVTVVILGNETIEQESYGANLRAKIFDDNDNVLALSYLYFDFNGESVYASIVGDEMFAKYAKLLNGTYLVNANTQNLRDATVKTGVYVITPLMEKELYVSTTGSDETGDGTEANPYATLKKAMDNAIAYNNTIHIAEGQYGIDNALAIDTNTAIINIVGAGENTVFDMNNEGRFISSISSNSFVTIGNLTLANGATSEIFQNGGFILSSGHLTVNNVKFINATVSGPISSGGAIYNSGNLTVTDSYFENTVTSSNGGAIYSSNYIYALNNVFNNTNAASYGGAIYSSYYLYINNNTFIDTTANLANNIYASSIIEGGVILTVMDNETWNIETSSVTFNASLTDENGNSIYASSIPISFYLDGISLVSTYMEGDTATASTNLKLSGEHVLTATLGSSSDITVKTATLNFVNPDVMHDVYISADGDDDAGNGTSENPYASFTKALSVVESVNGVIHVMSNYTISQTISISNLYGLTVLGETDDINFKGATGRIFTINTGASLSFENIKFNENSNTQTLIYSNSGSTLNLINCTFEHNTYNGMYDRNIKFIESNGGVLNLINCNISNNDIITYQVSINGILIKATGNSSFINCTFRNNNFSSPDSGVGGPLIFVNNNGQSSALFEDCIFEDNVGGFIYSQITRLIVENCSITNNNCSYMISISNSVSTNQIYINDSKFEKNVANYLIYSLNQRYINIYNNTFDSNEGLYSYSYLLMLQYGANICENTFKNNSVGSYFIQIQNNGGLITDNTFQDNNGSYLFYVQSGVLTIFNNIIDNDDMKYVLLDNNAKINGSDYYTITVNDNETWNIEGNVINLNATFMDSEGNYISGRIYFTLNGEEVSYYPIQGDIATYTVKYSENGEVIASAHTNNVYNPDSLIVKTALFNVTQLESKVIYVDVLGNDETGDGSEENPYATLLRAMKDVVAMNNIIYIQPGVYDNLTAGDFVLCDDQTLEIIGLSNEVDKVVIKNIDYRFIYLRYDSSKVSYDKFAIRNIEFNEITTNQRLFNFETVDDVEFSNVNITNCTLTSSNYLINDYFSHLTFSNVTISNLSHGNYVIYTDQYSTGPKPAVIEIYDSVFENFNPQYTYYTVLMKQSAIIENSVFNNITTGGLFSVNELNCTNSTFSNIICEGGNLITLISGQDSHNNIVGTVFTNCTVNDYIIDGYTNELNVSNSVFASNTFRNIISGSNLVANNNWWGYNTTAEELVVYTTGNRVDSWVVAEVTANDSDIKIGDVVKFDIVLKLNDGSELADILPTRIVKAIAENTVFDADEVEIADNKATISGTVNGVGDITISIDDQDFVFDVKGYNAYITVDNVAIKVGETATVTVTFTDDNGPLSNKELAVNVNGEESTVTTDADGKATITLADLAKGNHIVEVNFAGDNMHDPVTGAGLVMVSDAILTVDIPEVSYGESPTINVELKDSEGNPLSGLVTVNINGKDYNVLVKDGEGSLAVPDKFDAGEYTVSAKLIGDSSTESTATFVVDKLPSAMTVTVADVAYGEPFVINLDIADKTVSGLSIVTINGVDYAVEVVNGAASKAINAILPGGSYDVTAKFIGDNYDIADASTTFAVSEIVGTNVALTVKDIQYGENQTVTVTLTDANGNPISGLVKLTVGDIEQNITVDGEASVVLENLNAGNYAAIANYIGDDAYAPSNGYALFKVEKLATYIDYQNMTTTAVDVDTDGRVGKYFQITLKDKDGNLLKNKPVQFGFNGKVYDKMTNEKGIAELQINLQRSGPYTFAVSYLGDSDYNGSFIVAKIDVNKQKGSLTVPAKTYKASATKTLTATFKSASGKVVSGKKVTFTVNGKSYTATTNAKGVATVKVSLNKKGTYSFTAKFAGDKTYAAISKTAKLTIK